MENVTKEFEQRRDAFLAHVEGDENWEPLGADSEAANAHVERVKAACK